jgi:RNA polymerase sigma factor (sigma-70 family)
MMTVEQFTASFAPVVKKLAWRVTNAYSGWFSNPGEELKDLCSVGMLELVSIFPRVNFDDHGYRSYVSQRVHGSLLNYVCRNIPHVDDGPAAHEDGQDHNSENRIRRLLSSVPIDDVLETDHEPSDDPDMELLLFTHQVLTLMTEFMQTLSPRERFLVVARFQDERTYQDIGMVVGLRREAVSDNIHKILEKLGRFLRRKCGWHLDPQAITEYLEETDLGILIVSGSGGPQLAACKEKDQ